MIGVDALVVVAMADEAEPFLAAAQVSGPAVEIGGAVRHTLAVAGSTLALVRSGIGLVNAAAAAAAALAVVRPRVLVSAGSAGGLGADVQVGQVVVATELVLGGVDATAFGYHPGQVPGMPARYLADAGLVAAALAAGDSTTPTRSGEVLSADRFVTAATVEEVRAEHPLALSTDMESAALAQVAHLFGLPFASVRGISDLCGPAADADFATHVDDAAARSTRVVLAMLRASPGDRRL